MLKQARFQNFTCIPNDVWQFAAGVNVIVAENGLGKSHVLEALYALLKTQADVREPSRAVLEKAYVALGGAFAPPGNIWGARR